MESPTVFIKHESMLMDNLNEMEKIKHREELLKYKKECEDLKEMLLRSKEDASLWHDRAQRAEERYVKVFEDQSKMTTSNNKKIAHLSYQLLETEQKIEELRARNLQACGVIDKLRIKIKSLESGKTLSDLALEEMRIKKLEADKAIEELEQKNTDLLRTIGEFKHLVDEVDKVFEVNKEVWPDVLPRIKNIEQGLIRVLQFKVHDLAKTGFKNQPVFQFPPPICSGFEANENGNEKSNSGVSASKKQAVIRVCDSLTQVVLKSRNPSDSDDESCSDSEMEEMVRTVSAKHENLPG